MVRLIGNLARRPRTGRKMEPLVRTWRVFEAIRGHVEQTQAFVLKEHGGLPAIDQEGQLQQLVMGISATKTDMIQRLLVPLQAVGESLREADFRRQFGAQVIAIEQPDGSIQCPTDLDTPLQTSQRLVAIVWKRES